MINKPKKKVSNIMLALACTMITLYAAADFLLQYFTSIEVSPTLTTAWFAFWGGELFMLTGIKISKVLTNTDHDNPTEDFRGE
jgi:hypothetical protein